jgi:uncharacterized protein YjbJ (UPF0337 family)
MNWDTIEGKWDQLKGQLRSKWGKLTDDDVTQLAGKKDRLVGKLQERYGLMKDAAERQVDEWIDSLRDTMGGDEERDRTQPRGGRRPPGAPPH